MWEMDKLKKTNRRFISLKSKFENQQDTLNSFYIPSEPTASNGYTPIKLDPLFKIYEYLDTITKTVNEELTDWIDDIESAEKSALEIGNSIFLNEGTMFYEDSAGGGKGGSVGNAYTEEGEYIVNYVAVYANGQLVDSMGIDEGMTTQEFIAKLKNEGKISEDDNITVSQHVSTENGDVGWLDQVQYTETSDKALKTTVATCGGSKSKVVTIETSEIKFNDDNLYDALKKEIGYLEDIEWNDSEKSMIAPSGVLENITTLSLSNAEITDCTELRKFTNLTELYLDDNEISDISALSGLTNLTKLSLNDNEINDISALSGLTNLTELSLKKNEISDISTLSGLTNLTELNINGNRINLSDISLLEEKLENTRIRGRYYATYNS